MEFNLSRNMKGNKKGSRKYINRKKQEKSVLLNEEEDTVTKDTEKAEVLNAFFVSVFSNQGSLQNLWLLKSVGSLEQGRLPFGGKVTC